MFLVNQYFKRGEIDVQVWLKSISFMTKGTLARTTIVEYLSILAIIGVLAVVQSIFGMGILVFGTPTMLLMGYDFTSTLGYLLPASFALSLLQVLMADSGRVPVSRNLYLLCLPGIGVGLWLTESIIVASWANNLIGSTLLFSALVRFWKPSRQLLSDILEKYFSTYHLVMGFIHGLTNLGGAMLAILATGTNSEKEAIRYTVAHYYLAFSVVQMFLLAVVFGHREIIFSNLFSAVISATVFLLVGNRMFARTNAYFYDFAMTLFIAVYGFVLLLKS
jgi:uncharacterized protein